MSLRRLFMCLMLALVLALGVAACGGDDDDDGGGADTSASSEERRWVGRDRDDCGQRAADRSRLARRDLEERAGGRGSVRRRRVRAGRGRRPRFAGVTDRDADQRAARRPGGAPARRRGADPVAEKAMEAGIAVVNVDRLFSTPEAARATILGDNYGIGVQAGEYIAEELDCQGNVVEIQGLAGISVTEDRSRASPTRSRSCAGRGSRSWPSSRVTSIPTRGSR